MAKINFFSCLAERPYDPRPYDSRYARRDDRPPRDFDR